MDPISYYDFELSQIKHTSIRDLVKRVFREKVPKWFMEADVSNSSFYSSTKTGERIKLCERTKASVRLFLLYINNPIIRSQFNPVQVDYIIAALLLHDCALKGISDTPSSYNIFEHPLVFAYLRPDNCTEVESDQFNEIYRLVSTHHGPWRINSNSQYQLPEVTDNSQFYVHICDYMASKPMVWIDPSDNPSITKRFLG